MIELLRKRRSIRAFSPEKLTIEEVNILREAAVRSPSSRGINPWEFIFVDRSDLLEGLSRAKQHGSEFLKGSALAVVVCADETRSDVWVEDCSIAAIILQLTAQSLGLGSCWAQIRKRPHDKQSSAEDHVRELLALPENLRVEAIIGMGRPAERKIPVPLRKLEFHKIRSNRWDDG